MANGKGQSPQREPESPRCTIAVIEIREEILVHEAGALASHPLRMDRITRPFQP